MTGQIQLPVKGQPMRASWGASVSSAVNSLLPMGSDGLLARQGVAGTGFAPLPANLRDRRGSAAKIPGRFEITLTAYEMPEGSEPEYTATFRNPYYDIGGKTYEMPADETLDPPSVRLTGIMEGDIIAIRVTARGLNPTAELVTYKSIAQVMSGQSNYNHFIRLLYKVGSGGRIECDFRTGPTFDMGEFA